LARLDRKLALDGARRKEYRPLPFTPTPHLIDLTVEEEDAIRSERAAALRAIRDRAAGAESYQIMILSRLYAGLARGYDDVALAVLAEWFDGAEDVRLECILDLLDEASSDF